MNITPSFYWVDLGQGKVGVIKHRKSFRYANGQHLMVQVTRESFKDQAASQQVKNIRLSPFIYLSQKHCLYHPKIPTTTFSDAINPSTQNFLKTNFSDKGFTFRSSCNKASASEISEEIAHLKKQWDALTAHQLKGPSLLCSGLDPLEKLLQDALDPVSVVVDDLETLLFYKNITQKLNCKRHPIRMALENERPLFEYFGIEDDWHSLTQKTLPLPKGGNICIEQTTCAVTIDVNAGDQYPEEVNKQAVPLILQHLQWRGLTGNILIDFIDSSLKSQKQLLALFESQLQNFPFFKVTVLGWSPLGFLQMRIPHSRLSIEQSLRKFKADSVE